MKEYDVIQAAEIEGLIKEVNEQMELGWEPLGGVVVIDNPEYEFFNQTMIKSL